MLHYMKMIKQGFPIRLLAGLEASSDDQVLFGLTRIIHQGWRAWRNLLIGHRIRLRHLNPADLGAHARQA